MSRPTLTNQQWSTRIASITSAILSDSNLIDSTHLTQQYLAAKDLAKAIDHTLLKLDANEDQVRRLCEEARTWGFKTVCVRLPFVALAVELLKGTGIGVTCVIGFHEGTQSLEEKVSEAQAALHAGATELDLVLNHTVLFDPQSSASTPDFSTTFTELLAVRALAPESVTLKLILETAALRHYASNSFKEGMTAEQMIVASTVLTWYADFDFVKTSTGFWTLSSPTGARAEDVRLMARTCEYLARFAPELAVGDGGGARRTKKMRVKASGGIRTLADAKAMVAEGAERLGVSAGVEIVRAKAELDGMDRMANKGVGGMGAGGDGY